MKRFYNDDEDKTFEDGYHPYEDDGDEGEAVAYISGGDVANVMSYEIAQEELKHHIMEKAIEVAEKNWFWRFKRPLTKMREINLIYEWLKIMLEEPEPEMPLPLPEEEEE